MRTNCSFTQLDKHQLSSPGAHPSPTSLVLYHSKILRLDQVTVCSTLRLPLPCRAGHSDSQLSASCVTAAFTSKAAMGENEPAHCCIHLQGCRGGERAGTRDLLWSSVSRPGRALQNFCPPPSAWTLTPQPGLPVPGGAGKVLSCAPRKRERDWQSRRKSQVEMLIKNTTYLGY